MGIKQANLYSCSVENEHEFIMEVKKYNALFNPRDIYFKVLYTCSKRFYVITYRKKTMLKSLKNEKVSHFLKSMGYPLYSAEAALDFLAGRITSCDEFPHEIGLLLGYPADDVFGFIKHKGTNFKFCGYWKVYCNEEETKKMFANYRKCTSFLLKKAETGMPLPQILGVA